MLTRACAVQWHSLLRRIRKLVLRLLTRTGELERLLLSRDYDAGMPTDVDAYIFRSKQLRQLPDSCGLALRGEKPLDTNAVAFSILREKGITPKNSAFGSSAAFHTRVLPNLLKTLGVFNSNAELFICANRLASIKFDTENEEHERLLLSTWQHIYPDSPLVARQTEQWALLGFQGRDPATDFRSSGELGLRALEYTTRTHRSLALAIIESTSLPYKGFPLALVVIALCEYSLQLLRNRRLLRVVAEAGDSPPLTSFHEIVCQLLRSFHTFWWATSPAPASIMEFPRLFAAHKVLVESRLAACGMVLIPVATAGTSSPFGSLPSAGKGSSSGVADDGTHSQQNPLRVAPS